MTNEPNTRDGAAVVVFVALIAVAATNFTIQAYMTYGFAGEVWQLPASLCVALIVALDVFAVMFMVLTYLLRGTGWPRFAVTVVFLFAIAAQVFAAEQYGEHEAWTTPVRWFSALPAVFLALAQEGVIMWRTHRTDRAPQRPGPIAKATREVTSSGQRASGAAPVRERPPRSAGTPAAPPVSSGKTSRGRGRQTDPRLQKAHDAVAQDVLAGRVKLADAASGQHVSTRAVQNWVASYRERNPARIFVDSGPGGGEHPIGVNGQIPQLNGGPAT